MSDSIDTNKQQNMIQLSQNENNTAVSRSRTRSRVSSCSSSTEHTSSTGGNVDPALIGLSNVDELMFVPTQLHRRETFPPINTPINTQNAASLLTNDSIEMNVGGKTYTTSGWVLAREPTSWLAGDLTSTTMTDRRGRYFIDRNGEMFSHILEYLKIGELQLPSDFKELQCLKTEANHFGLKAMSRMLTNLIAKQELGNDEKYKGAYITLTEHATYNVRFRENVKVVFKRISSITVAGYVKECRKVFGTGLSLDRDSNENLDRYSCRMVLMDNSDSVNFDKLREKGYEMVVNNKTDAATLGKIGNPSASEQNKRWVHVTNYYFCKKGKQWQR